MTISLNSIILGVVDRRFSTIGFGGLVGQGFQRPLFEMGLSTGD